MSIQPDVETLVVVATEQDRPSHRPGLRRKNSLKDFVAVEGAPDLSPELVVDFSQVTFMGSAGIHELIDAEQALKRRGGRLIVRGAHGVARRCLEVTGFLEHFGGASTNGTGP